MRKLFLLLSVILTTFLTQAQRGAYFKNGIRLGEQTQPTNPKDGRVWFDGNELYVWEESTTQWLPITNQVTSTDLNYVSSTTTGTITSSTGLDAVIPVSDALNSGLMKANFYEEGVFTPVLETNSTNGTVSSNLVRADYVRVGNIVTVYIQFDTINSSSALNGTINITGLPFPHANLNSSPFVISIFTGSTYTDTQLSKIVARSFGTKINFHEINQNSNSSLFGVTFTNGLLQLMGTYTTNIYTP